MTTCLRLALYPFVLALLAAPAFAKEPVPASQFLDKSWVTIPRSVGRFTLEDTQYDPALFQSGVSSSWRVKDAPETLKLNLYIYPLGRGSEAEAVQTQIADVESAVREGVKQGIYTELTVGERTAFEVVARKASIDLEADEREGKVEPFDPMPKPGVVMKPSDDADPILAAVAESLPPSVSRGWRQSFRFSRQGTPMRSLGYVFYRHLFAFKLRVSVPESDMEQSAFEQLADEAARWLVPHVDTKSFGQCGTISIDPGAIKSGKGKDSGEGAAMLVRGIGRIKRENCASDPGKSPEAAPTGSVRETIVYPPGTWKSN